MKISKIKEYFSDEELEIRFKSSTNKRIRDRWHLLWLVQALNYFADDASISLGYSRSWGYYWIKQYNMKGPSVIVLPKTRNPEWLEKKVTDEMKIDLLDKLQKEPPEEIGGGLWSGPKVAHFIKVFYDLTISRNKGWNLLKECDYSITSVRPKHRKSSDEDKDHFKKKRAPKYC
ncbi:MAG: winged helix-turn-helix domain-containing protein [Okeania sp. SIO3B3]|nr:winged helix-turn-helix domain-containing protein [Okeania sp. SIO3B3]